MKQIKNIVIILAIPYLLWHLYYDFLEYKNYYIYKDVKFLEMEGKKIIKKGYYNLSNWGNRCNDYRTSRELGSSICINNLKMKLIKIYDGEPYIIYRGQSDVNKSEMCELDLSRESEGEYAGELVCDETWFKTSEADKIPIGKADVYARKLKEKSTKE